MRLDYKTIKGMTKGEVFYLEEKRYELVADPIESYHEEWETEIITLRVKSYWDNSNKTDDIIVVNGFVTVGPIYKKEID